MPDVGMADYQMTRQRKVISACEKWWPLLGPHGVLNKSDCSGFVSSVASELSLPPLTGSANEIYDEIQHSPWSVLGRGDSAAHLAAVAATNGKLVIGAWRHPSGGSGHVAVIVDTNYAAAVHRTRALAYWGTLGLVGEKRSVHSKSWGESKRPEVVYSVIAIS